MKNWRSGCIVLLTLMVLFSSLGRGDCNAQGGVELPLAISEFVFNEPDCSDWNKFSPTSDPDTCASWTSWDLKPIDKTLRSILREEPGYEYPGFVPLVDSVNLIKGDPST